MKISLTLALLALAVLVPGASAAKSKSCPAPAYPTPNGSFSSLKVTKVSCATGKKVVLAYHACRTKNGPAGRCVKKVRGYACQEQRTTVGTQIEAKARCAKGKKKKVSFSWQQTG
jgi:hypothetical protein